MRAYLDILRIAEARRLFLALLGVRLGYAMISVSVSLLAHERSGSWATAGLAVGVFSLMAGATAPLRGHLVDRYGQTWPVAVYVPAFCLALALMPVAHGATAIVVLAGVGGATSPPVIASARPLWRDIVGAERLRTAYAADSTQTQATMIVGAPVAYAVTTATSAASSLYIITVLVLIGGVQFLLLPTSRRWRGADRLDHVKSALHAEGMRTLVILAACIGAVFGTVAVALPAWVVGHGSRSTGVVLLGIVAVGGVVGGAWWGTRGSGSPVRALVVSTSVMAVAFVPVAFVRSAWVLGGLLLVVGACVGIGNVLGLELIDRAAPPGTAVSAFTWMVFTESAGMGLASTLAGHVIQAHGASVALGLAAVPAVFVPVMLAMRRRTLRAGQWPASSQLEPAPTETSSGTLSS